MNKNYIKNIIKENYNNMLQNINFKTWLEAELTYNPESFDCFFKHSWDEITENKKVKRIKIIKNIFNY